MTPQQAANQALAAIDPTTAVTVDGTARVARRSAYTLILRPKDTRSLVGSVRIAIDSKTDVPLRVQVFAKGGTSPAFETGFTTVTFAHAAGLALPVHAAAEHQGDHQAGAGRRRRPPPARGARQRQQGSAGQGRLAASRR